MRLLAFLAVAMILSSSVVAVNLPNNEQRLTESLTVSFQEPCITEDEAFVDVTMQGAAACVYRAGKPILPMYTTTIELPFGSRIIDTAFCYTEVHTKTLSKKISSAPYPIIGGTQQQIPKTQTDEQRSGSKELYPEQWMTFTTGGGINEQQTHVTFLTLQVYPVRYCSENDTILYLNQCQISITYEKLLQSPFPTNAIYDLVIITPDQFVRPLQRLAEHKNIHGIRTLIKTLEDIYQEQPGYDKPEQIKYYIKDAMETWGIHYVLLVGGLKSHLAAKPRDSINEGSRDWHLPVRYTNLYDIGDLYDPGFISDLYYADVYDSQGTFCSWDSGSDGVYGGWSNPSILGPPSYPTDLIDFFPDVYLGRLPCRNRMEVVAIVHKIIAYEKSPADNSWFKRMVVVAGDPYDDQGTEYLEGELIGEKSLNYMAGFEQCTLFASNKETNPQYTPETDNILREISKGCGFLFFDGHGSPCWWNTFWPGEFDTLIQNGGIRSHQIPLLRNGDKLPVCILGGCHNNLFNVSILTTVSDRNNEHFMWSNGIPVAECLGWRLTAKPNGGAIATIGNTGLGYEAGGEVGDLDGNMINEPDCVESLCGYLESQFFKSYGVNQTTILGDTWCSAVNKYLKLYPGMENCSDAKTVEQWVLLGDPSLKIGGYR